MIYLISFRGKEYPLWYDKAPRLGNVRMCSNLRELRTNDNRLLDDRDVYFEWNEPASYNHNAFDILKDLQIKRNYDDDYAGRTGAKNTLTTYVDKNEKALRFLKFLDNVDCYQLDRELVPDMYNTSSEFVKYLIGAGTQLPDNYVSFNDFVLTLQTKTIDDENELTRYRILCDESDEESLEFYKMFTNYIERMNL